MISSPGCLCCRTPPRGDVDAHLDDLASGDAEIVPLEIGALHARCCACATAAPSPKAAAAAVAVRAVRGLGSDMLSMARLLSSVVSG